MQSLVWSISMCNNYDDFSNFEKWTEYVYHLKVYLKQAVTPTGEWVQSGAFS